MEIARKSKHAILILALVIMEEDGFKLVNRRKKPGQRKGRHFLERNVDTFKRGRRKNKPTCDGSYGLETIRIDSAEELQEQIEKCRIELRVGGYLERVRQSIEQCFEAEQPPAFTEIVCYGLGSFTHHVVPLYQLALLVALKEELRYSDRIVIYDPCFTDFELKILPSFGFHVLEENTECQYPVTGRTLFFMLHMYRNHYNNVLKSNWHQLELVALYSNSFEDMMRSDHLSSEYREDPDWEYLFKLADGQSEYQVEEQRVRNEFPSNENVFNNLSILTFTKKIKDRI